jgi:endonuclease YncB( thermonuclease family)
VLRVFLFRGCFTRKDETMIRLLSCCVSLALTIGAHAENLAELAGVSGTPEESSPLTMKPDDISLTFAVTKAISGDTLQLDSGKSLKLLGVKSPEPSSPNGKADYFSKESTAFTNALTKGKEVAVTFEKRKVDGQGRWLGFVWLPDGESLNQKIVAEGYGFAHSESRIRKDYQGAFDEAQETARIDKVGLWTDQERAFDLLEAKTARPKTKKADRPSPGSPRDNLTSQFLKSQPSVSPGPMKKDPVRQQPQKQQMRKMRNRNQRFPAASPVYGGYAPGMAQPGMTQRQNFPPMQQGSGTTRKKRNRRYEGSYQINYAPDGSIRGYSPKKGNPPSKWRYGAKMAPAPDPRDSSGLRMK